MRDGLKATRVLIAEAAFLGTVRDVRAGIGDAELMEDCWRWLDFCYAQPDDLSTLEIEGNA